MEKIDNLLYFDILVDSKKFSPHLLLCFYSPSRRVIWLFHVQTHDWLHRQYFNHPNVDSYSIYFIRSSLPTTCQIFAATFPVFPSIYTFFCKPILKIQNCLPSFVPAQFSKKLSSILFRSRVRAHYIIWSLLFYICSKLDPLIFSIVFYKQWYLCQFCI